MGIELMLSKKKGINSVNISLDEKIAIVEYDSAMVTISDIVKAVSNIGYTASARNNG